MDDLRALQTSYDDREDPDFYRKATEDGGWSLVSDRRLPLYPGTATAVQPDMYLCRLCGGVYLPDEECRCEDWATGGES